MKKEIFDSKFKNLEQAVKSFNYVLTEAKKHEKDDVELFEIFRDSVIQRFEYTFELSWKFMKFLLKYQEGEIEIRTASQTLKFAFKSGYIDDLKIWFEMLEFRNKTSHEYEEDIADDLYYNSFKYNEEIQKFYELIKIKNGQGYFRYD